jgi:hypothetical protein
MGKFNSNNRIEFFLYDTSEYVHNGYLHIQDGILEKFQTGPTNLLFANYRLSEEFDIDADQMTIETRVKNNPKEGGHKENNFILILNTENIFNSIHLINPCCHGYTTQMIAGTTYNGMKNDNSAFGIELYDWKVIKVIIKDRKFGIYADDYLLEEYEYTKKMGLLKSIVITFKGNGFVDYFRIYDNERDSLMYGEEF